MDILEGSATPSFSVLSIFLMGINSHRREFAPCGANSFHEKLTPFARILFSQKKNKKTGSHERFLPWKFAKKKKKNMMVYSNALKAHLA